MPIGFQLFLHRLPEGTFDDCRLLTFESRFLVGDLTNVDRVTENAIQMPPTERSTAGHTLSA